MLNAFFRPHAAMTPLPFANRSLPSSWIQDFHLQGAFILGTQQKAATRRPFINMMYCGRDSDPLSGAALCVGVAHRAFGGGVLSAELVHELDGLPFDD